MTTLMVHNLPETTTERDLENLFGKYGKVGDIYIPLNFKTRGFAFVRYIELF